MAEHKDDRHIKVLDNVKDTNSIRLFCRNAEYLVATLVSNMVSGIITRIDFFYIEEESVILQSQPEVIHQLLGTLKRILIEEDVAIEQFVPRRLAFAARAENSILIVSLEKLENGHIRGMLQKCIDANDDEPKLERINEISVLVTYAKRVKDFKGMKKQIETQNTGLVVLKVFDRAFLLVKNLAEGTTEEDLGLYFNRRQIGGGDISHIYIDEKKMSAVVQFKEVKSVFKVIKTKHVVKEKAVHVEPYNFFVSSKGLRDAFDAQPEGNPEVKVQSTQTSGIQDNSQKISELTNENARLKDEVSQLKLESSSQQAAIEELKKRNEGMQKNNTPEKCSEVKVQSIQTLGNQEILHELRDLKNENARLKDEVLQLNLESSSQQEAITSRDIQIEELKKRIEGKEARDTPGKCSAKGPNLQEVGEDSLSRKDVTNLTPIAENGAGSVSRAIYVNKIVAIKDYNSRHSTKEFNRKALYSCHEKMKCYAGRHTVKAVGVVDEEETETCWHVTEYEERGSLRKVLADESRSFTWMHNVDFALGVCQCVMLLHNSDCPKVLGKIGSNKFLLGLNWEIKMCDFALTGNPDRARVYLKTQNRSYMPLEHFTESPMTYNMTTECHGVGVILIEIATRKSATEAKTLPDDCPDEYRKVVNGLMEPDPCSRMNIRDATMALTSLRTRLCAEVDSNGSCS